MARASNREKRCNPVHQGLWVGPRRSQLTTPDLKGTDLRRFKQEVGISATHSRVMYGADLGKVSLKTSLCLQGWSTHAGICKFLKGML